MATVKKSSAKKRVAPKRNTTSTKTSSPRKRTSGTRSAKATAPKSFRLSKDRDNFMDTNLTSQSVYWLVLGIIAIAFASWILKVQADVQAIYNKINVSTNSVIDLPVEKKTKTKDN